MVSLFASFALPALNRSETARAAVAAISPTAPVAADGPYLPLRATPEYGDGLDAGRGHEGQDLFAPAGTPLVATRDAVVLETGSDGGRGNYVAIYSDEADQTYNYFHMIAPSSVSKGQVVVAGQELGGLGCTGSCWGDHLHFEVHAGRSPYGPVLNPVPYLNGLGQAPTPAEAEAAEPVDPNREVEIR